MKSEVRISQIANEYTKSRKGRRECMKQGKLPQFEKKLIERYSKQKEKERENERQKRERTEE